MVNGKRRWYESKTKTEIYNYVKKSIIYYRISPLLGLFDWKNQEIKYHNYILLLIIKTMILGLAPMDWFTDCAMRQITQNIFDKYWNKSDFNLWLWTEFMTADGYMRNPSWVIKHLLTNSDQKNLIAQIFWWNQENLVNTAVDIQIKYSKYFKWIELNTWCPANNTMKSWWWARLLTDKKIH